jgi:group II intron reverse transcriptase/maturase
MTANDATTGMTPTRIEEEGRKPTESAPGAEAVTATDGQTKAEARQLMEAVVERTNLMAAYQRVMRNKGAAGVDGLPVSELKAWVQRYWPSVRAALLDGSYLPSPVRKVEIPKPNGGVRTLGIPTVLDRLIQQALLQILQPLFEPGFSESSYGFRPGRNAWQAVTRAKQYIAEGRRWVVDVDLEKFFDRVSHDILMSRVARQVKDERVLKLIRRYLEAGMLADGIVSQRSEGTPQGGPLSPLLSNILLTDLDRELERRGHRFCRYADDCNIYVGSQRAGEHLMTELTAFLEGELQLKVNPDKSAVARPWERKFLGYGFTMHKQTRLKVAESSLDRLKARVRELVRRGRGRNIVATIDELTPVLRGWMSYYRLTEARWVLEDLDGWIRRKLRCILWRQWKRPFTRAKMLQKRGLAEQRAWRSATNQRGPWWNAGARHMSEAYPKKWFSQLGLVSLLDTRLRFQRVK